VKKIIKKKGCQKEHLNLEGEQNGRFRWSIFN